MQTTHAQTHTAHTHRIHTDTPAAHKHKNIEQQAEKTQKKQKKKKEAVIASLRCLPRFSLTHAPNSKHHASTLCQTHRKPESGLQSFISKCFFDCGRGKQNLCQMRIFPLILASLLPFCLLLCILLLASLNVVTIVLLLLVLAQHLQQELAV